jgi:hypothetical protein
VNIDKCFIASDQFVIRTLQKDITEAVKNGLVQLIDIKQRQIVCLTPVNKKNQLLIKKPQKWDEIKENNFMIINGQHSITASKELQISGCGEKRKNELKHWNALIVWSLDHTKLRNISKFYNCTNHLNHAQPTWGNQIIACRNIWITYKRPAEKTGEHLKRSNNAIYNVENYKVYIIFFIVESTMMLLKVLFKVKLNCCD